MPIPDSIMSAFHNTATTWMIGIFLVHHFSFLCCVPTHLITVCVLWLVFTAFSSIAISTVNHADSRASLASLDSNPSTSEKSSEKTDNCEKVQLPSQTYRAYYQSAISYSYSILIGSSFLDPKTLVFDRLNSSVWQVRSSRNQESSYVLSSHYENNFRG